MAKAIHLETVLVILLKKITIQSTGQTLKLPVESAANKRDRKSSQE
jgi:hypothetical protein